MDRFIYVWKIQWENGGLVISGSSVSKQCLYCKNLPECVIKLKLKKYKHIPISKSEALVTNHKCCKFPCSKLTMFNPKILSGVVVGYDKPDVDVETELRQIEERCLIYREFESKREAREIEAKAEEENKRAIKERNERRKPYRISVKPNNAVGPYYHTTLPAWDNLSIEIGKEEQKEREYMWEDEFERYLHGEEV